MKKRFVGILAAVFTVGLAAIILSCGSSTQSNVIKIGVFEPLTGANGAGGADEAGGKAGQYALSRSNSWKQRIQN